MSFMALLYKGFIMTRLELIQKIENRKKQININIENLAKLSN